EISCDLQRTAVGERADDPALRPHRACIVEVASPQAKCADSATVAQHIAAPAAVGSIENAAAVARHIAVPGGASSRPVGIGTCNVHDQSGIGLDIAVPGAASIVDCPCIAKHLAVPGAAIPNLVGIAAHVAMPDGGFAVHDAARIGDHVAVPVAATAVEDPVGVAVDIADPVACADLVGAVVVDNVTGFTENEVPLDTSDGGDAARIVIGAESGIGIHIAVPYGVPVVVDPAIVGEHVAGPHA